MKLELRGITKRFGALVANDHIDLTVEPGEIHCLLGENGAGKSTLMNVLYGLYQADEGEILLDDAVQHFAGPGDAMRAGIGMVHQHFMLVPVFTVAENVMLGHEQTKFGGRLDLAAARAKVREISARFGFDVDPDALVEDLPVGVQQRVEIIKALSRDAKVLVFDEPTAVLTPQETDELMAIMRQLKDAGHRDRLHHPQAARGARGRRPDHGHPPRQGRRRGRAHRHATPSSPRSMVGRAVELTVAEGAADARRAARSSSRTSRSSTPAGQRRRRRRRASSVRARRDPRHRRACRATARPSSPRRSSACRTASRGTIAARRHAHRGGCACAGVLDAGVGFVPEDRQRGRRSSPSSPSPRTSCSTARDGAPVRQAAARCSSTTSTRSPTEKVKEFDVRAQGIDDRASAASPAATSRRSCSRASCRRDLRLFVAAQPTRGLDVGSIEFVHERIVATRDAGVPVIVVSTELDEVVALADRIAVMYRGRIVGIVPGGHPPRRARPDDGGRGRRRRLAA